MAELQDDGFSDDESERKIFRGWAAGALLVAAFFAVGDVWEDLREGVSWLHVALEAGIVVSLLAAAYFIYRETMSKLRRTNASLRSQVAETEADAKRWRQETSDILKGLSAAIEHQFERWNLSDAEAEIALLLLKGLSQKEIADIRQVSERNVRQQSGRIYDKAGLKSLRSEKPQGVLNYE